MMHGVPTLTNLFLGTTVSALLSQFPDGLSRQAKHGLSFDEGGYGYHIPFPGYWWQTASSDTDRHNSEKGVCEV